MHYRGDKMFDELKKVIAENDHIVFFGGAGVSTESNIPDFRSDQGIYQKKKYPYPAEVMLSATFFRNHPKSFFDFYLNEMIYEDAQPNLAHKALARLEATGKLDAVITQNIDGLHQKAGSKRVLELHGSVLRNTCMSCGSTYSLKEVLAFKGDIPRCGCSGIIKPDVVLYEESLNEKVLNEAIAAIRQADVLIIGGTSLVVYPAAGLIQYFKGKKLVLINKDQTSFDKQADIIYHESIGKVLAAVIE